MPTAVHHRVSLRQRHRRFHRQLVALAALSALALPMASQAVVAIAGSGFTQPGSVPGNDQLWIGSGLGTSGSIDVSAGDTPTFGAVMLGWQEGDGRGAIDGAGTTLTLNTNGQRLVVANWGTGYLGVSNGAKILADGNATACNGACNGTVSLVAGSNGTLQINGAGSEVRLRDSLNLAVGTVDTVNGFGTVGGHTVGTLLIQDGGVLSTGGNTITGAFNNNRLSETSTARITISGTGALWSLNAGSQTNAANRGPFMTLSNSSTNETFMNVVAGGELRFNGTGNVFSGINMGSNGGTGAAGGLRRGLQDPVQR